MVTLLWAKTIKDGKLIKDVLSEIEEFDVYSLTEYLKEICYRLDIETPIILSKHYRNINQYNIVKFTSDDFVDYIDFDSLVVERSERE